MLAQSGFLVVIDGLDGSGKATQQKLLAQRLKSHGYPYRLIDFPRYYTNFFGAFVGECLAGRYGPWGQIDPHIASVIYAADRYESSQQIKTWLQEGYIVVADRYVSANQIYQGGKIKDKSKRYQFLRWLDKMEYEVFKIPRPDVIIYLDVPVEVSMRLSRRTKKGKEYLKGRDDVHEKDAQLLIKAQQSAIEMVKSFNNWISIECMDNSHLLPPETIADNIWRKLHPLLPPLKNHKSA